MLERVANLFAVLVLSGCATFGDVKLEPVKSSTACPKAPTQVGHAALCGVIDDIVSRSEKYYDVHAQSDNASVALGAGILTSAITSAGLAVFDGGADAIAGTAFGGGALSVLDNKLNLDERAMIARDGVAAFQCLAEIGDAFALSYVNYPSSRRAENTREYTELLLPMLGSDIALARRHVETVASAATPEAADGRQKLTQLLLVADEEYEKLAKLRDIFVKLPPALRRTAREADDILAGRLRSQRPNLQQIVAEIQALAREEPAAGEPTDTGASDSTAAEKARRFRRMGGRAPRPTDQDFIDALNARILEARAAQAEIYIAEFDRIPACKAEAAA